VSRRTESLTSGGLRLALHTLAEGPGRPLLILHGLGEHAPSDRPSWSAGWPGPVLALDFTGHGESAVPVGGGYMPESLMADVDAVLTAKGACTIVGRGLGAWVGLLIAGARPELVHGVVLHDGSGIAGGGPQPPSPYVDVLPTGVTATPDPFALLELSRDVRPPDYALDFVRFAIEGSELEHPIVVSARIRPDWLVAVAAELDVLDLSLVDAVAHFADRPA
jgi:pimeloyl-ACP methyl ester carboxylesterase